MPTTDIRRLRACLLLSQDRHDLLIGELRSLHRPVLSSGRTLAADGGESGGHSTFHEITDQLPKKVWMAIGRNDWTPKPSEMSIRELRFADDLLTDDVETHVIEGAPVKVFGVAKSVTDCFRHRSKVGLNVAIEGLQEALRQRKSTPAQIMRAADKGGVSTVIRPYLEALTANG